MLSNEYIAGFFDGEGCIVLTKNGQCKVIVVQKTIEILRLIQVQFGGSIYKRKATKIGGESCALQFSKKETMLRFLEAIRPHCVVKRDKVEIAIPFIRLTQSNENRRQETNGHFLPSETSVERDLLRSRFYRSNEVNG